MRKVVLVVSILAAGVTGCKQSNQVNTSLQGFDEGHVKLAGAVKKLRGQTLYLPAYSSIPYAEGKSFYGLSAFVAVHNTDLRFPIRVVSVYYLDNDGRLVKDFLGSRVDTIGPLQTVNYFVPESDKSVVESNFILEWMSDSLVNEPLVESIMVSLTSGQGVSFLSEGKVINEIR